MITPLGDTICITITFSSTATSPSGTLQYRAFNGSTWSDSVVTVTAVATSRADTWDFFVSTSGRADTDRVRIKAQATVGGSTEYQYSVERCARNVPLADSSGRVDVSTPNVGAGASPTTVRVLVGGNPVADADVWVSSDAAGDTVVAGTLQTDSDGEATFMLDTGVTYYLWAQKDGVNAIRGEEFEAE